MTTESIEPATTEPETDYFTLMLDERISGMEIDITRDELRALVQASQIVGVSPVDFLREATLAKALEVIQSENNRGSSSTTTAGGD